MRWLIPLLMLCAGCGPTEVEAGQAVILMALPITLTVMPMHVALIGLWRTLDPSIQVTWHTTWTLFGCLVVLSITAFISGLQNPGEWTGIAFWAVGASYASVHLVTLRLAVTRKFRGLLPWALTVPWMLLLPPAIMCAAGSRETEAADWVQDLWVLPGYAGVASGGLLMLSFIELAVRRWRASRRRTAPLPEARIHNSP